MITTTTAPLYYVYFECISVRDIVRNDGSVIGLYNRVDHEGYKGTVKFIGTLPDTTGKCSLLVLYQTRQVSVVYWYSTRHDR
jgi:hypothetical protein